MAICGQSRSFEVKRGHLRSKRTILGQKGSFEVKRGHLRSKVVTNHVDGQLAEISVELTGESEASGDSGHGGGDEVVEISVGGGGEFEGAEADVIQGLVVDTVGLVGVFDELVDGEGGVVGFDNGV